MSFYIENLDQHCFSFHNLDIAACYQSAMCSLIRIQIYPLLLSPFYISHSLLYNSGSINWHTVRHRVHLKDADWMGRLRTKKWKRNKAMEEKKKSAESAIFSIWFVLQVNSLKKISSENPKNRQNRRFAGSIQFFVGWGDFGSSDFMAVLCYDLGRYVAVFRCNRSDTGFKT